MVSGGVWSMSGGVWSSSGDINGCRLIRPDLMYMGRYISNAYYRCIDAADAADALMLLMW